MRTGITIAAPPAEPRRLLVWHGDEGSSRLDSLSVRFGRMASPVPSFILVWWNFGASDEMKLRTAMLP